MINKKGFTLVELLVVIAIIGILSSVAIVNLNNARIKARVASVQGNLSALIPAIILCHDDGLELQSTAGTDCDPGDGDDTPTVGQAICSGSSVIWPGFPAAGSWAYVAGCDSDSANGTFTYEATGDGETITCDNTGCLP